MTTFFHTERTTFASPRNDAAPMPQEIKGRLVNATEFQNLMVSHRRMERVVCTQQRLRGLRDLDTGEVFLTDERRLLLARR